ncbi:hypothetical protein ALC53_10283 [Atta colombica]|uniref:Uncharacterized protein n=1 Tax=Atta colombica TaxID=520822 RepID=A0A151I0J0_9HYME|nr:hypothetical protein ALC53_10283 [Atta colombica]
MHFLPQASKCLVLYPHIKNYIKNSLNFHLVFWYTTAILFPREALRTVYLNIHSLHRAKMSASIMKSPSLVKAVQTNLNSIFKQSTKDFSFPSSIAFLVILREDGDILSKLDLYWFSFFRANDINAHIAQWARRPEKVAKNTKSTAPIVFKLNIQGFLRSLILNSNLKIQNDESKMAE